MVIILVLDHACLALLVAQHALELVLLLVLLAQLEANLVVELALHVTQVV